MNTSAPTTARPRTETKKKSPPNIHSIGIVGLGYVGLPLAILAEERGIETRGFDIDTRKVDVLKKRIAPFLSEQERREFVKSKMMLSTSEDALDGLDAYIVCVPTPVDNDHRPDLAPLMSASESVGRHLKKGALVVIESTVNPGVCEDVALAIIERESGLKAERDFLFAHCPERINPGDAKWDVRTIPRVIGAVGPESLKQARALYESLIDGEVVPMANVKEAEAVKMVENSFRDVNIAFVNELAMSFSKAGIDIVNVLRGASTKPFAFMAHYPGCGVGGHCIPVDPYYLIRYGRENGFEHRFLATARKINNGMPHYTVDLLEKALLEKNGRALSESTVALLGLAYKRDVPDLRESPALEIHKELERRGATVAVFDPLVQGESTALSVEHALAGADAALLATDHSAFRALLPQDFLSAGVSIVVDGRNCLPKDTFLAAGITYRGIGR